MTRGPGARLSSVELRRPTPSAALEVRPLAAETLCSYASDWIRFATWCKRHRVNALPARAATVEKFLSSFSTQYRPGTLRRWRAAIVYQHRQYGLAIAGATDVEFNSRVLQYGSHPQSLGDSISPTRLTRIALSCRGDTAGLRDRALCLLLAASGLGRTRAQYPRRNFLPPQAEPTVSGAAPLSEMLPYAALLDLDAEQIRWTEEGFEMTLANDSITGGTRTFALRRSQTLSPTCPVQALQDWLQVADCRSGPVFCQVDSGGTVEHRALTAAALRQILFRRGAVRTPRRPAPQAQS